MLALLPVDPGAAVGAGGEPASTAARSSGSRRSRAANAISSIPTPCARAKLRERAQPVELGEPVDAVAGGVRRGTTSACSSR